MTTRRLTLAATATALACAALAPAAHAGPLGDWAAAAPEPVAPGLAGAAAATLANGQVLLAGGTSGPTVQSAAELYTPATNGWAAVAALPGPRMRARAATLPDGGVLVVGGTDSTAGAGFASALIYDPNANTWTVTAPMSAAREWPAVAPLGDGRILVAGGRKGPDASATVTASAEIYDPAAGSWSPAAPMGTAREGAVAMALADGDVLVAGGESAAAGPPLSSAEIYDPTTNAWTSAAAMATPRFLAGGAPLPSGGALVAAGAGSGGTLSSAESYDPDADAWTSAAPVPNGAVDGSAAALADGRVLVVGGRTGGVTRAAYAYRSGPLLSATRIDFGSTTVGHTSAAQAVTVTNMGVESLLVRSADIAGLSSGDFAIVANGCAGHALALYASCQITVQFTPSSTGAKSATLHLTQNDQAGTADVPLDGAGTPQVEGPPGAAGADGPTGAPGNPGQPGAAGPVGPSGPSAGTASGPHFPLRLISRSATMQARGRVPVQVVCPIATGGCSISWAVYVKSGNVRIGKGERFLKGRGAPHTLTLVLNSAGRRMVRRGGLTATVHIRSRDKQGVQVLTSAKLRIR